MESHHLGYLLFGQEEEHPFMDKTAREIEVSNEATRESLIAISNSLPEKEADPKPFPGKADEEAPVKDPIPAPIRKVDSEADEKFRSELISISDSQPEAEPKDQPESKP